MPRSGSRKNRKGGPGRRAPKGVKHPAASGRAGSEAARSRRDIERVRDQLFSNGGGAGPGASFSSAAPAPPGDPSHGAQVEEIPEQSAKDASEIEEAAKEDFAVDPRTGRLRARVEFDKPTHDALVRVAPDGSALVSALFPGDSAHQGRIQDIVSVWGHKGPADWKRARGHVLNVSIPGGHQAREVLTDIVRALRKWKADFWQGRFDGALHRSAVCEPAVGFHLTSYDENCQDVFSEVGGARGSVAKQPLVFEAFLTLRKVRASNPKYYRTLFGQEMTMQSWLEDLEDNRGVQWALKHVPAVSVHLRDGKTVAVQGAVGHFVDKVLKPAAEEVHRRTGVFTVFGLTGVFRGDTVRLSDATGISVRVHRDTRCLARGASGPPARVTAVAVLRTFLATAVEALSEIQLYDPAREPSIMSLDTGDVVSSNSTLGDHLGFSAPSVVDLLAPEPSSSSASAAAPIKLLNTSSQPMCGVPTRAAVFPVADAGVASQFPSVARERSSSRDVLATTTHESRAGVDYSRCSEPTRAPNSRDTSSVRATDSRSRSRSSTPVRLPDPSKEGAREQFAQRMYDALKQANQGTSMATLVRGIVLSKWTELTYAISG